MEDLANYIYEIGTLKRIRRSGWGVAGIKDSESVAEHVFRAAVLGFVLAVMEGADPLKTAALCLFHDMQETRVGDLHRINRRYLRHKGPEQRVWDDQVSRIPPNVGSKIAELYETMREKKTHEARLAREADLLECLVQAREYQAQGSGPVSAWIHNSYAKLRSPKARKLAETLMAVDPQEWWQETKANSPR